jgi:hypothetical protein
MIHIVYQGIFRMTKITLSRTLKTPAPIRQAIVKRDWMDKTYNKHAYQCTPVTTANVNGWEMLLPEDVTVIWDGGNSPAQIISGGVHNGWAFAHSNINGMISFATGWVINTEKNYSLWTTGSPNYYLDGASPMTASIPSSWWADEVQTNWVITKVNEPVTFLKGTPFVFFTIYETNLLPSVEFEVVNRWDYPELIQQREEYNNLKIKNSLEKPWTWIKGIKSGLDARGNKIGPKHAGIPKLAEPDWEIIS